MLLQALIALAPLGQAAASDGAPPRHPPSRELLLELTATARLAGTSGGLWGAEIVARRLAQAGWQVESDDRVVLLSLPRRLELALFEGGAQRPFVERAARFDPDAVPPGDVPSFSAWSASGSARGPVVDVGHGLREDYERLAGAGVDVRGKVALARYGRAYRGVKADMAQEHGCAALLLFSDPAGDGDERGPVWPEGPWKPDWDAQRGSIAPMARAPGDPTTPGWPSPAPGEAAERASEEAVAASLPRIPCLPIGARDARAILARIDGAGPGPVEARVDLDVPRELRTIRNVVARLPGRGEGLVLAGSHRDAWVRGANDAGSGNVALLRAAQHLGARSREGWRPLHTLVVAFWDAEEQGLIGSTEWAEAHAELLRERGLAYVNADAAVGGRAFAAAGTPGLAGALRKALERVPSLVEREGGGRFATIGDEWSARFGDGEPLLTLPGSGSDFAAFLHHLGLPVLDVSFHGADGGQYHTAFDDFAMVERFIDPGFEAHETAGRLLAELLAVLADDPAGGFDGGEAARALALELREAAAAGGFVAAEHVERLAGALEALAAAWSAPRARPGFYIALEAAEGLAGRPWYRNRLWAPGLERGYGAETFPSLRAAAARGDAAVRAEVDALAAAMARLWEAWSAAGEPAAAAGR